MKLKKGRYEIFKVGDERIISDSRDKIKEYAKRKGVERISYMMSVDTVDNLKMTYIKL